jgi:uncharacterized membrane protein
VKHKHPVNQAHHDDRTFGERVADDCAAVIGSWRFLIGQGVFLTVWVTANTLHGWRHWDDFPYILLNLCLSVQAAVAGPMILLAGNRQSKKDRATLEHDFDNTVAILAELQRNTNATLRIVEHLGCGDGTTVVPGS